jgi:VWFA-related protein
MTRLLSLLMSLLLLPQAQIKVDVRLQQIVVTVRDSQGNLVRNLGPEDFVLEEGGVPQTITHFVADNDTPVSLCILVDVSGSMAATPSGPIPALRAAVGTTRLLLHLMKPQDEFCLMSFSNGVDLEQPFTHDVAKIEQALSALRPRGGTNLQEGVEKGLLETRKGKYRKKALILVTDAQAGLDTRRLQRAIQESEVLIYTFALHQIGGPPALPTVFDGFRPQAVLDTLASESGGRSMLFELHSDQLVERMIGFVQDIAAELRGQYLIGYYPPGDTPRAIRIRSKNPEYRARHQREALVPLPTGEVGRQP